MTKDGFEILDISQQQELVNSNGKFIRTQTTGSYIFDTYNYDDFYVVFFCLIDDSGEPGSRCFGNSDHIEHFIHSIDRPMS